MKTLNRKKINFMIDSNIELELKKWIPEGKRSDFANSAFERALTLYRRNKVCDDMDKFARDGKMKFTDKEFIKLKNYGRK